MITLHEGYDTYLEEKNFEFLACMRNYGASYKKHWHRHIEYHYIIDGEYDVTVDGKTDVARKGDFLLIFPYSSHSFEKSACSQLFNIIDLDVLKNYNRVFLETRPKSFIIRANQLSANVDFITKYVYDLIPRIERDENCHMTYMNSCETLEELVLTQNIYGAINCLIGEVLRCTELVPINEKSYIDTAGDTTSRIMRYCLQNFSKEITLDQMSKDLFLNKHYISKVFSNNIGMSLYNFINSYRIDRCCELLRNTNRTIVDIMFECGFKNQGSFNNAFKKIMKMTPKEYRNQ